MSRYIDADKVFETASGHKDFDQGIADLTSLRYVLEDTPTADVAEVVRCKDCKYLIQEKMICTHIQNRIFNTGSSTFSNHFCSYGERKEDKV